MKILNHFIVQELKHIIKRRSYIALLILFIITLILLQYGINKYKATSDWKTIFQDTEHKTISFFLNHTSYGAYGIRILFLPHVNYVFFRDSLELPGAQSMVDSGDRLKIYHSLKGKNIFSLKKYNIADFSGIILFFGSLLVLFYGFTTFLPGDYLRMLSTLTSPFKLFLMLLTTRFIIILCSFLILLGMATGVVWLNGLTVPVRFLFVDYFFPAISMLLVFLLVGMATGTLKKKFIGFSFAITFWLILQFLFPAIITSIIEFRAEMIEPLYSHEYAKLKLVTDFEKRCRDEIGRFGKIVTDKEIQAIQSYLKNEFKRLGEMEDNLKNQMSDNIAFFHKLSMILPTSHYSACISEMSGSGYLNFINYYSYTQDQKRKFFHHYKRKIFDEKVDDQETVVVEDYVKKDENLFYARNLKPKTYWQGILLQLFYVLILAFLSYRGMLKLFAWQKGYDRKDTPSRMKEIELEAGRVYRGHIYDERVPLYLYRFFNGLVNEEETNRLKLDILDDGERCPLKGLKKDFIFIDRPEILPGDIKVKDYLKLIYYSLNYTREEQLSIRFHYLKPFQMNRRINSLEKIEKAELMLVPLYFKRKELYIINDLMRDHTLEYLILLYDLLNELANQGSAVIQLTTVEINDVLNRTQPPGVIRELTNWNDRVESIKTQLSAKEDDET